LFRVPAFLDIAGKAIRICGNHREEQGAPVGFAQKPVSILRIGEEILKKTTSGAFILLFSALFIGQTFAADHYIRAGATGTNNGNDWTNAFSTFPSSYTRGDTYYIASGAYPGNVTISSGESGSSWIHFKKATAAVHGTSAGWNDAYAKGQALINGNLRINSPSVDFDGVTGSGNTGHGIRVSADSCSQGGVVRLASGISHVHIRHVEVSAIFKSPSECDLFYQNNVGSSAASDINVSHSWLHDCSRNGVTIGGHQGTGWADSDLGFLFEYNRLERTGGSTDRDLHGQGVQAGYSSKQNYHVFRGNTFKDIIGSAIITYLDKTVNNNIRIYNNVFTSSGKPGDYWVSPAVIWIHNEGGTVANNVGIYNNTFYNIYRAQIQIWPKGSGNESLNNLYVNNYFSAGNGGIISRHNAYFANTGEGVPRGEKGQQYEKSRPVTNAAAEDFTLVNGARAINNGMPLTSYFSTDIVGTPRPQGPSWDIGAYEFKIKMP
jgi:hypothetical protein